MFGELRTDLNWFGEMFYVVAGINLIEQHSRHNARIHTEIRNWKAPGWSPNLQRRLSNLRWSNHSFQFVNVWFVPGGDCETEAIRLNITGPTPSSVGFNVERRRNLHEGFYMKELLWMYGYYHFYHKNILVVLNYGRSYPSLLLARIHWIRVWLDRNWVPVTAHSSIRLTTINLQYS